MRIVPDSQVVFYSGVDIVPGEQHLAFDSENARNSYFAGKVAATYTNTSMVRKDGTLLIDASVITPATMFTCNYLSFVNPSWGNKRFFGFIVDVDYMNNETMIVKWTIDEFESWRFDAQYDVMTIERQHISQADAQKNPYDPSILEYRTVEKLPVGPDTENPYYDVGLNGADGVFLGDRLCDELGVTNTLGLLIAFSDMDLKSKDSTTPAGQTTPSARLAQLMDVSNIYSVSPTSFSIMSPATYSYLSSVVSVGSSRYCFDHNVWDPMYPLANSRITPPISYIFLDGAITPTTEISDIVVNKLANLLEWFTENSFTDAIIGMYPMTAGMVLFSGSKVGAPYYVGLHTASDQQVNNKKLDLFPFSYYRLIGPNGDVKELKIEDFHDAQVDDTDTCKVAVAFDAVDNPALTVAPINYKVSGISPHALTTNANTLESLVFAQFPTMPYIISGWESQRAAIANSFIANNTLEYGYQQELAQTDVYGTYVDALGNLADAAVTIMGGSGSGSGANVAGMIASFLRKAAGGILTGSRGDVMQDIFSNRIAMSEEAYDVALGKKDTAIDKNFQYTRPAYANNIYHRSNGAGFSNFMNMAFCDVLFLKVTLNPDILAKYDEYFDRYGYTSGEIGIPRVINFMNGSVTPSEIPEWRADGTTYVKTTNCIVKNVPMPVADAIAQMFNAGIRFYHPTGA